MYWIIIFMVALSPVTTSALELDRVVISAGDGSALADVAQPVLILDEEALSKNSGASLGTLLEDQPGISNASFGLGVGRPVLRGMSGSRVKMMVNGHDSVDLSAMSSDHAPMTEVSNARQVEVIQGPATPIYGNGAIGGVVNVIDNKIATEPVDQLSGSLGAKVTSTDQGRQYNSEMNGVPNEENSPTRVKPKQIRYDIKSAWLNPLSGINSWTNQISFNDYEHDELLRHVNY